MAEFDTWRAAQNWILFSTLIGGVGLYYYLTRPNHARAHPPPHHSAVTPKSHPVKKAPKKARSFEKKPAEPKAPPPQTAPEQEHAAKPVPSKSKNATSDDDFVKGMMKARQGIDVNASGKGKQERIRTVKPKGSASTLPSGMVPDDGDDGLWSAAVSPLPKISGVEDMLEAPAQGPTTLRIIASQAPKKERPVREAKKDVVESKKQRQNRQKVEQQKLQRQEDEGARKAQEERQRRAAREARGEPAKNGVKSAQVPATNAWSPHAVNGHAAPGTSMPLLDTFDVESTSSSNNDAHGSTAATSTTDGVPSQWADEPADEQHAEALTKSLEEWEEVPATKQEVPTTKQEVPTNKQEMPTTKQEVPTKQKKGAPIKWSDEPMDEQLAEALKNSEVWKEVPTKHKSRTTKHDFNGSLTAAGAPINMNGSSNGFSALSVEDDG